MRLFQNSGVYASYLKHFDVKYATPSVFVQRRDLFLKDRYCAAHILKPVLEGDPSAFFTNADDKLLQQSWASAKGISPKKSLEEILLAQIEDHETEVFYNLDPMRYGSEFIKRLPGCVKKTLCWRAAPSPGADFSAYDTILCNFPAIIAAYKKEGWRADYFSPAHDPVMDAFAANRDRTIDVLFVGGYTRHHRRRSEVLEAVANMKHEINLCFHLDRSRIVRLAETGLGKILPLQQHRRPKNIQAVTAEPVFGLDLYEAISNAKIVLNGAIDMAGKERGNMRCFEAMGCGALMISDEGLYPPDMCSGKNMITYSDAADAVNKIKDALSDTSLLTELSDNGHRTMQAVYTKEKQWHEFYKVLDTL